MHSPIFIQDLCLSFSGQFCFEDFNNEIRFGNRIAIVGRNGSGKSALLKILLNKIEPTEGEVIIPNDVTAGYVAQTIDHYQELSGGQRFNKSFTEALAKDPNMLLLDEPTNHLDLHNRNSLMSKLNNYYGTLIVVTHDIELLRNCVDILWHIEGGKIHVFSGCYDHYMQEISIKKQVLHKNLVCLKQAKKTMHHQLMKEQTRAAGSKRKGEKSIDKKKWPTVVSKAKAGRGQKTSGKKKAAIMTQRQHLQDELDNLYSPEVVVPKFSLETMGNKEKLILSISEGFCGYSEENYLLRDINLTLNGKERIAIIGNNGSGKSTLL